MKKKIKSALISVYKKEGLDNIVSELKRLGIVIYSTGGTLEYLNQKGIEATAVEELTKYPSILGGRVKTLHPKVFGGILARRDNENDKLQLAEYQIPEIDLIIVDLYPFKETLEAQKSEQEIIEKIDIGGISLIRAGAKNFSDVLIISSSIQYKELFQILNNNNGETTIETRKKFAGEAFTVSSEYDKEINSFFIGESKILKYGENPHQKAKFIGDFDKIFEQIHGKEISYNNLLDIDAAIGIISEFNETTFAVLKHNNPCGLASRNTLLEAWNDALAGDPVSAFGGVIVTNKTVDDQTAEEINKIFFEVIIAPGYSEKALEFLKQKKNRIILIQKEQVENQKLVRTALNGYLEQDKDLKTVTEADLNFITNTKPTKEQIYELIFANKIVKHTKSNAIILTKNKQLIAGGVGQTSRVDALKQAIDKAHNFSFNLEGAIMASDAFFPFSDSVEIAHKAGINAIIQPGGSIRDNDTIDYCNQNNLVMVFTGIRHFKH
jgi:phosphoribosylaminoimidazolecarboxamide formyltransferase/IMP cyclohydrolase